MAKLKNYTTQQPVEQIVGKLQKTLGEHGARKISFEYDDAGKLSGITFAIMHGDKMLDIRLPAKIKEVKEYLERQWNAGEFKHLRRGKDVIMGDEQVYRIAWVNVLAWVEAQMTFIALGQVKFAQAFLAYTMNKQGLTLYDVFDRTGFANLPMLPQAPGSEVVEEGKVVDP